MKKDNSYAPKKEIKINKKSKAEILKRAPEEVIAKGNTWGYCLQPESVT